MTRGGEKDGPQGEQGLTSYRKASSEASAAPTRGRYRLGPGPPETGLGGGLPQSKAECSGTGTRRSV